ncbi:hypothetical protein JAAARDRAFT_191661 [Jaapia argillacea MUCL 33604]|uniref:Uncharacterized protein n=1 Tax=Jaapia argillacea MUCL 33604 TaxID=933084 RepID=A0A067Q281_9AGAM|nr:hypothetical protein JAAARDRAFT_191661 [Jaapia argillacea MUCL 33604]
MSLFHAYLKNSVDDATLRYVMTFASREVADEWWRIVSTPPSPYTKTITRISPQFYTHKNDPLLVCDFFCGRYHEATPPFLGRMFFTTLNRSDLGDGLAIIPPIDIADHVSGNW